MRGIPIAKIVAAATVLQASGKFKKGVDAAYRFSAGLNGVGLTAANALADWMRIIVCQEGIKHEVVFKDGRVIKEGKVGNTKETGTDIEFKPAESVLGKIDLDYHILLDLAETFSHLSRTKIKVHITAKGKDGDINKVFKSNGIVDSLLGMCEKKYMLIDPIYFRKEIDDKRVEVAMTFVGNKTEETVLSFANYCTTVDHGTHVSGVKTGMTRVLSKYVKDNLLNAKEKEKLQITGEDCRSGWVCVVNADHIKPGFVG